NPASPIATLNITTTPQLHLPIHSRYNAICAIVTHSSSTASVTHIFAATITIADVARINTVHVARCGPTYFQQKIPITASTPTIANDDGNRAANAVGPNTFIATA